MTKRRFLSQLPAIHQTQTLQKFFSATVDQVFQPGSTQNINAFIGQKPSYFDSVKDFYKQEINGERQFYQLEPAMTTKADETIDGYTDLLFYQDLVNNLRFQGANVDNHSRLFESEQYSWCPPIDVHKLNNFREYYWLPDGPPVMVLDIPKTSFTGDGIQTVFSLPATVPNSVTNVVAHIDGVDVTYLIAATTATTATFSAAPADGAKVELWVNPDFLQNINTTPGLTEYSYPLPCLLYATQTQTNEYTNSTQVVKFPEKTLDTPPNLQRYGRVEIRDNNGTKNYEVEHDVDGTISLIEIRSDIKNLDPVHVVIDRSAVISSPWSRVNHWFHKSLMIYNDDNYQPARASRPIIEFADGVQLFNYGADRRLPDFNDFASFPDDVTSYNGQRLVDLYDAGSLPLLDVGTWLLDSSSWSPDDMLQIAVVVSGSNYPVTYDGSLAFNSSNQFVGVGAPTATNSNYDNVGWEEDFAYDVELLSVQPNDITQQIGGSEFVYNGSPAVWHDGLQGFKLPSETTEYEPLFSQYDVDGGLLSTGTKIFSFKRGTTEPDSILKFPVSRNSFGSLEFEDQMNQLVDQKIGFKFYKFGSTYGNNWNPADVSVQNQTDGYYSIPTNLQANPLNSDIGTVSANEWNDHFKQILAANPSSWLNRSVLQDRTAGRKILQNRFSLLHLMLLNSNSSLDYMKAVTYSEREYLRYRGKFSQLLNQLAQTTTITDVDAALTRLLTQMRSAKTADFPFSNNGMADDEWFIPATGSYLGATPLFKPRFLIDKNSKGVEVLYIRGHDGSLIPGVTRGSSSNPIDPSTNMDVKDQVLLALENKIYQSTTPALRSTASRIRPQFDVLALSPGYSRSSSYTRGEFLSLARPMFERWASQNGFNYRENAIYDENNRLTWNFRGLEDFAGQSVPGNVRGIYRWYFDTERPHQCPWETLGFTSQPNWWTGYYPGSENAQNIGWDDSVKVQAFLDAIRTGMISKPDDPAVYDIQFARPTTYRFYPVDSLGRLLDPIACGLVPDVGITQHDAEWEFGDGSPMESSWWNSLGASFVWAQLGYLMKPAGFIESNWRTLGEKISFGQWIHTVTNDRSLNSTAVVHNEITDSGSKARVLGVQAWISDYLTSQGKVVGTELGNRVRTLNVNLAHKLGGFIDPVSLKAFTENNGLLPQEDVLVALYRSPSVREEFYGGAIVERTARGWRVLGYDVLDPAFKTLPVRTTGKRVALTLGDAPEESVDWHANTYYTAGILVFYKNTNYRCTKTHTSATKFEQEFWTAESTGRTSPAGKLTWFTDHEDDVVRIPYNTEFYTRQDVAEFLSGYQAYLQSRGWKFDFYDGDINEVLDFKYSAREFLVWTQTEWPVGAFITLSPSAKAVKFTADYGTVQNVEQLVNGAYSMVDRAGRAIEKKHVTTNRLDDTITVGVTQGGVYGLRVFVSEVEQAIVFKNRTIFNDVIYDSVFDQRQSRIRIIANISQDWKGRLDAPGFIITDNRLIPSFEQQVEDLRNAFSIEAAINLPLRDNARHQIGYQSRTYLENLMYNEVNQFEFYQGMIQQKGAPGVFSKLLRNNELTQTRSLNFLEEWAFRRGVYGGVDKDIQFEFILNKDSIKSDPQLIQYSEAVDSLYDVFSWDFHSWDVMNGGELTANDSDEDKVIKLFYYDDVVDSRFVIPPKMPALFPMDNTFHRNKGFLPNAGYARINETDFQALNFDKLNDQIKTSVVEPTLGHRVWVYDTNEAHTWDVFQLCPSTSYQNEIQSFEVNSSTGGRVQFTMDGTLNIEVGDWVFINRLIDDNAPLSGFHEVVAVEGETFTIDKYVDHDYEYTDEDKPQVFVLVSSRIQWNQANKKPLIDSEELGVFQSGWANLTLGNELSHTWYNLEVLGAVDVFENSVYDIPDLRMPYGGFTDGYLIYVDVCYEPQFQFFLSETDRRWCVFAYDAQTGLFKKVRQQPAKVRSGAIKDIKIFDTQALRTNRQLNAKPLLNSDICVWDPIEGIVPGVAQKEVFYKLDYDPAAYNAGASFLRGDGQDWGTEQVGRLWWDLSTTRYVLPNTDATLTDVELKYRTAQWGRIAPGSSVDIYEWVKSEVSPQDWQEKYQAGEDTHIYDSEVLNPNDPNYVEGTEWNQRLQKYVTVYYFWVKNRKNVPNVNFRAVDAFTVAQMLGNPAGQGLSWVAPISEDHMLLAACDQFLTGTSSVQFTVARSMSETKRHVEWQIMRNGDERSLPDNALWGKIVTSLTARDIWSNVIPDSKRYFTDQVGYDVEHGQNMFKDVKAARKHVVQYLNTLFTKYAIVDERRSPDVLNTTELEDIAMQWSQKENSQYVKPVPPRSWWTTKTSRPTGIYGDSVFAPDQLVYSMRDGDKFWNVSGMDYWDPSKTPVEYWGQSNLVWQQWNGGPWEALDNSSGWENTTPTFQVLASWHYEVASLEVLTRAMEPTVLDDLSDDTKVENDPILQGVRDMFAILPDVGYEGLRVLVRDTMSTGFWSIWETHMGSNGLLVANLMQVQRYDSGDCWNYADWYAEGYSASDAPSVIFNTTLERDLAMGENPYSTFVKIKNNGKSQWIWTTYENGQWIVVAKQNATIELSDTIFTNTGNFVEITGLTPVELNALDLATLIQSRDRGFEFNYMLNALRESILTDLELNQMFFSLVNYAHTEQDFIDWCFKTSYMYVTGYSDRLRQDPVAYADLTENLLEYINEVKPYHVKVRDFISKYKASDEVVNVSTTDFDLSMYVDLKTGTVRMLDWENTDDAVILSQGKYVAWWDKWVPLAQQFKNGVTSEVLSPQVKASPVRKLNVSRGHYIPEAPSEQFVDEMARFDITETITIEISRFSDIGNIPTYDVGPPKSSLYSVGNVDFTLFDYALHPENFEEQATNWDNALFDMDFESNLTKYIQRSLIVESNGIYDGEVCATPFDLIDFWGEVAPTVIWDQTSDTYSWGSDNDSWFDNATISGYGYGMQLANYRVISIRLIDGAFSDNRQVLHVLPKTGVAYRLHIVNSMNASNSSEFTDSWVASSTAAPIGQPL